LAAASEFGRVQDRAEVRVLEAALVLADRNAVVEGYRSLPGYERMQVYGGDGCPGVADFAPIEFGAVMRMSSGAAAALIGEALALRHRLPRIWAAVRAGKAVAWRARKVAHACLALSLEAAAIVDRRVAGIVDTVTPGALDRIVKAAVWEADPEAAKAEAEAVARIRGVFDATIDDLARALKILGDTDDLDQRRAKAIGWISDPAAAHQLLEVARYLARTQSTQPADAQATDSQSPRTERAHVTPEADNAAQSTAHGAAEGGAEGGTEGGTEGAAEDWNEDRADALYDRVADAAYDGGDDPAEDGADDVACDGGDGGDPFTRMALAGTLAERLAAIKRAAYSDGLGAGSGQRNRHTLYVHLTDRTLATGNGVLRVEELGPLLAGQLAELLGHDQVVVKPVIDLQDQVSVHSYEIPDRIPERVRLQHPVDMFPYSGAEATARMDQDHVTPYERAGPPGQTTTDNLIPLGRLHHRAKTFGGWRSRCLPSGAVAWTSPHGFRFVVDHTGTYPALSLALSPFVPSGREG
jgi:hypothetical protein